MRGGLLTRVCMCLVASVACVLVVHQPLPAQVFILRAQGGRWSLGPGFMDRILLLPHVSWCCSVCGNAVWVHGEGENEGWMGEGDPRYHCPPCASVARPFPLSPPPRPLSQEVDAPQSVFKRNLTPSDFVAANNNVSEYLYFTSCVPCPAETALLAGPPSSPAPRQSFVCPSPLPLVIVSPALIDDWQPPLVERVPKKLVIDEHDDLLTEFEDGDVLPWQQQVPRCPPTPPPQTHTGFPTPRPSHPSLPTRLSGCTAW